MFVLTALGDIVVAAVSFAAGWIFKDKIKATIAGWIAAVKAKL